MRRGSERSEISAATGGAAGGVTLSGKTGMPWVGTVVSVIEEPTTDEKGRRGSDDCRDDTMGSTAMC
jgi:hypothetical protein